MVQQICGWCPDFQEPPANVDQLNGWCKKYHQRTTFYRYACAEVID